MYCQIGYKSKIQLYAVYNRPSLNLRYNIGIPETNINKARIVILLTARVDFKMMKFTKDRDTA